MTRKCARCNVGERSCDEEVIGSGHLDLINNHIHFVPTTRWEIWETNTEFPAYPAMAMLTGVATVAWILLHLVMRKAGARGNNTSPILH